MPQILTLCGSTREDSINRKTVLCISNELSNLGANVSVINLKDFEMPIYNGDDETANGLPEAAVRFQECLNDHDALVIGCPEYNGFMTPVLLNTIAWATRSPQASLDVSGFMGKPVLITSSSPGPGGGSRSAVHLKTLLSGIGCIISPGNFMVSGGFSAFDESGKLMDEGLQKRAVSVAEQFHVFVNKLI
ncbi:MAG: NADPH-dependent FMN reductase [Pseudomonadales bacterium]|jgi:NAD(P)H-dependent FMN reductase